MLIDQDPAAPDPTDSMTRSGLLLGLCAVLESAEGELSYWALRHSAGGPDFHDASTFALSRESGPLRFELSDISAGR